MKYNIKIAPTIKKILLLFKKNNNNNIKTQNDKVFNLLKNKLKKKRVYAQIRK